MLKINISDISNQEKKNNKREAERQKEKREMELVAV